MQLDEHGEEKVVNATKQSSSSPYRKPGPLCSKKRGPVEDVPSSHSPAKKIKKEKITSPIRTIQNYFDNKEMLQQEEEHSSATIFTCLVKDLFIIQLYNNNL